MKKSIVFYVCCAVFWIICWILLKILVFNKHDFENTLLENVWNDWWINNWEIHILSSIDDEVEDNSMWCGTFQLVWNDMVNEVVKQDVEFNPQPKIVENLNKQTFTNRELSPSSYYSKFWLLTLNLKKEIENWIKEKFNESSNLLDQLDWSNVPKNDGFYRWSPIRRFWFYAMLKKIFKFENMFDELEAWKFADNYDNIRYFWINWSSSDLLHDQVYVYYYNSNEDFAVFLKTKEWENVILARWASWSSFMDIYNNILKNRIEYKWNHYFTENDYLKVPELSIKTLNEFIELENKEFPTSNGTWKIEKALQTIELKLDKEWWELKSEAWITYYDEMDDWPMVESEYRYFYFDKPYVMFLKEADKDLPYFAAQISDITLFQN